MDDFQSLYTPLSPLDILAFQQKSVGANKPSEERLPGFFELIHSKSDLLLSVSSAKLQQVKLLRNMEPLFL